MSDFIDFLRDQFAGIGPFSVKRMFGGQGLYWRGHFFGLVADDTVYLRTDERNRPDYEARGLTPFKPWEDRKVVLKAYFPLPEDVLDDGELASAWARKAIDAALAAGKEKLGAEHAPRKLGDVPRSSAARRAAKIKTRIR